MTRGGEAACCRSSLFRPDLQWYLFAVQSVYGNWLDNLAISHDVVKDSHELWRRVFECDFGESIRKGMSKLKWSRERCLLRFEIVRPCKSCFDDHKGIGGSCSNTGPQARPIEKARTRHLRASAQPEENQFLLAICSISIGVMIRATSLSASVSALCSDFWLDPVQDSLAPVVANKARNLSHQAIDSWRRGAAILNRG